MDTNVAQGSRTRYCLDIIEAAAALSISPRLLRKLLDDGTIRSVRLGRRRLIPCAALEALAQGRSSS